MRITLWDVERGGRIANLGLNGVIEPASAEGNAAAAVTQSYPYLLVTRDPGTGAERREPIEPSVRIFAWSDGRMLSACDGRGKSTIVNTASGQRILTADGQGAATLWRPKQ